MVLAFILMGLGIGLAIVLAYLAYVKAGEAHDVANVAQAKVALMRLERIQTRRLTPTKNIVKFSCKCGSVLETDSRKGRFCPKCGRKFKWNDEV